MSRSRFRNPGREPESFNLRWHSVANPATPSVDIMSSPDPLNDPTTPTVPEPISSSVTRRVTRSQRSQKLDSINGLIMRQTLKDGPATDESQSLFVSVEDETPGSDAQRKLFPTSSSRPPSRKREPPTTTTTTVPLNDSLEDDMANSSADASATPKPKRRIRTSNGTPLPMAGSKRRAGTPIRRTARRYRSETPGDEAPEVISEVEAQGTPTPKRRIRVSPTPLPISTSITGQGSVSEADSQATPTPRRSARRARETATQPLDDIGLQLDQEAGSARRTTRRRRQALAPGDLLELAGEVAGSAVVEQVQAQSEDGMDLVLAPSEGSDFGAEARQDLTPDEAPGPDIWMATLSNEATPRATSRIQVQPPTPTPRSGSLTRDQDAHVISEIDYGYLAPAASDISSADEEPRPPLTNNMDTIAHGEDFSMIFMDSIPSLHAHTNESVHPTNYSELGEETNMIINTTLESLRHEAVPEETAEDADDLPELVQSSSPQQEQQIETEAEQGDLDPVQIQENEMSESVRRLISQQQEQQIIGDELREAQVNDEGAEGHQPLDLVDTRSPSASNNPDHQSATAQQATYQQIEDEDDGRHWARNDSRSQYQLHEGQLIAHRSNHSTPLSNSVANEMHERSPAARNRRTPMSKAPTPLKYRAPSTLISPLKHTLARSPSKTPTVVKRSPARSPQKAPTLQSAQTPRRAPGSSPLRQRVLKSRALDIGNSTLVRDPRTNIDEMSRGNDTPQRNHDISNSYDDSFSEIPQEILLAATPGRPNTVLTSNVHGDSYMEGLVDDQQVDISLASEREQFIEEAQETIPENMDLDQVDQFLGVNSHSDLEEPQSSEEAMIDARIQGQQLETTEEGGGQQEDDIQDSNASITARSEASRLPTPNETPPHVETYPTEDAASKPIPPIGTQSTITSPLRSFNLSGSALRNTTKARDKQSPSDAQQLRTLGVRPLSMEATPLNQISSPVQEPQSLNNPEPSHDRMRPTLSAIVRAGRVLQSVTSDPPSPDGRDAQLGSPFRSSTSKDSGQGSKDSRNGRWLSKSPTRPLHLDRSKLLSNNELRESAERISPRVEITAARNVSSAMTRSPNKSQSPHPSATSSMRQSPPSDGRMSWIAREGPIAPQLRGDNTLQEAYPLSPAAQRPLLGVQTDGAADETHIPDENHQNDGVVETEVEDVEQPDDETDIWEFEAQRETPRTTRQQPFGKRTASQPPRRRAAVSSPRKRPNPQPTRSTAPLSHRETPKIAEQASVNETQAVEEEYSLLARRQAIEEAAKSNSSAAKTKRFELSSFFSSPANIPGMMAGKFLRAKAQPAQKENEQPASVLPTSSMFPQPDQVENQPGARRTAWKQQPLSRVNYMTSQPRESSRSPDLPNQINMPKAAHGQRFTPRSRQTSHTFAQPASGAPLGNAATPPRMQLSHADIRRWQQETSSASASGDDSHSYVKPLLRPLPPKNASPSKSILRSPLKPRTPGRVVEFTSSVLSPVEQARVRSERRMSNASVSRDHSFLQHAAAQTNSINYNKENRDSSDVLMSDAPPSVASTPRSVPVPLSQTVWTREHWVFLDWLIQTRRERPFEVDYDRCAERFLGKTVRSHGEAMTLERWHLDCVDAFQAEVGGWDEGGLIRRLFALMLGEEKRISNGLAGKSPTVMFH